MNPHHQPQEDVVGLLPCPFCGSEAEIERAGDHRQSTIYQCTSCSCSLETGEEWGHGKRWNTRATQTYEAGRRDMREAAGWQPIETAPKEVWAKSQQVLTCHADKRWTRFGRYYGEMKRWYYSGTSERSQWSEVEGDAPTHWMPFPALPTEPLGGEPPRDNSGPE